MPISVNNPSFPLMKSAENEKIKEKAIASLTYKFMALNKQIYRRGGRMFGN